MKVGDLVRSKTNSIGIVVVSLTGSKYASVWFPDFGVVSFLQKRELEVICK